MSKFRTAKQVGDLMGLSVKALRLYEAHGLISPDRTSAGWRVYGAEEVSRLHKIQALKSIGFSLADIGDLFEGGVALLDVLNAQTDVLSRQRRKLHKALGILARARGRITAGETLSTDDLIHLTKETDMSEFEWTEAHQQLAERNYSAEQIEKITSHKISPEFQAEIEQVWQVLIEDAERLRHGPADSAEAKVFAQRWLAANEMFTGGDADLNQATANWYEDGYANPETAGDMPFAKDVWAFAQAAIKALHADPL